MKILVPVKRVIDPNVVVRVKADGSGVETQNVKMAINPFDEIALEEAIRLKERGVASEVVAVSVGPDATSETLRSALALGADRGLLVRAASNIEPLVVAKVLKEVIAREDASLVLMGKQAIDNECNQTGQMLAALLGWPQCTFASAVQIDGDTLLVTREVDDGTQDIETSLPAVVTVDLRLNTPRYASLPNIMKAKKKPLDTIDGATLGIDFSPRLSVVRVIAPPRRQAGIILKSVDELVAKLKEVRSA